MCKAGYKLVKFLMKTYTKLFRFWNEWTERKLHTLLAIRASKIFFPYCFFRLSRH